MNIEGKIAVITGGVGGLGGATVERFLADGAKVAIFDVNKEAGEAAAKELGKNALFCLTNVADEGSVQAAFDKVIATFGAVHICCNYAGIGIGVKTVSKKGAHPMADYKRVININLVGTFNVASVAAELMSRNEPFNEDGGRGLIINTASAAAYEGQVGQVAYASSKGGVVAMTLPMARDLASYGVRVNTIVPGLIHTPPFDQVKENQPDMYNSLASSVVYPKRLGHVNEIAKLAAHIVDNDYINGECIRMDGAIRMQPR